MFADINENSVQEDVNNDPQKSVSVSDNVSIKPPRKKKEVQNTVIIIPTSDNYNSFLNHTFNSVQLKGICKHYKLPVTGTKQILTNTIYKYLYLSHYAMIIQQKWRKYYVKIYAKLHGPARFKRHLCVNETDFFTMDAVKDIPYTQFFSYQDSSDKMIYGFDIMSLYNLITKNENNNNNNNNNNNSNNNNTK